MKRREFLLSSALTALGLFIIGPVFPRFHRRPGALCADPSAASGSLRELRALFSRPEHAEAIGRVYLETEHTLPCRDAFAKGAGLDRRSPHVPLREHIRKRSGEDFAQGNTVIVNGWVLSKAEACACALLTLA